MLARTPPDMRGQVIATQSLFQNMGALIPTLLAGIAADIIGVQRVAVAIAVLTAGGALAALTIYRPQTARPTNRAGPELTRLQSAELSEVSARTEPRMSVSERTRMKRFLPARRSRAGPSTGTGSSTDVRRYRRSTGRPALAVRRASLRDEQDRRGRRDRRSTFHRLPTVGFRPIGMPSSASRSARARLPREQPRRGLLRLAGGFSPWVSAVDSKASTRLASRSASPSTEVSSSISSSGRKV